ncbi:S-linalool synthase-like [Lycium ferocissimum]|uniref:S-linalool synthase-like n=1 Tax=Lycium ferocissimum TaxID=112874 RepID=UPI0028163AB9|nr:S-linalool synthase-like [Lycium ferocissimum]
MDSSSLSSIESLVNEIKKELLISNQDFNNTFLTQTSAYDTAWLAMIPYNNQEANGPMFESCLNWILNNQNEQGFWGEPNGENLPTIYALPTTLACMIALKKWNVGESHVRRGKIKLLFAILMDSSSLSSIESLVNEIKKELLISNQDFNNTFVTQTSAHDTAWLAMIPFNNQEANGSMVESCLNWIINNQNEQAFWGEPNGENLPTIYAHPTTLSCMVALKKWNVGESHIRKVPSRSPVDKELEMLCMVDNIQRMGVAQHFEKEIQQILDQVYKNYQMNLQTNEYLSSETSDLPERLFKDSLAFRLLRLQGYKINQGSFCWFLNQPHTRAYIEKNQEQFAYAMYNVYRATDLMFNGESEMEEARSFSRNFLVNNDNLSVLPALQKLIEHELNVPWFARLEHLDHRLWIELNQSLRHTIGKSPYYWLSYLQNDKLMQLAVQNYEYRQSIYRKELEDLKSWSKEKGLVDIGFGREKTTYSYFASAASSSSFLPYESFLRLVVAKCSIIITVADDFYDEEASLSELQILTEAIQRWDAKTLDGPSKIIFEALDDLVCDVAEMYHLQHKIDINPQLRHMWKETFHSWMMESSWSRTSNLPSMDAYLKVGMISIGAHILVLHATSLGCPTVPSENLGPINGHYENITKLLMATTRLLNDIQSYQKEREVGKMNYTLLHLNENPEGHIEDSITFVKDILGDKKKEFLENVLMDGFNDMPRTMKLLHLSCLNVFHMFFNSSNLFDTQAAILEDIMKAIYIPLQQEEQTPIPPPLKPLPPMLPSQEKKIKKQIEIAKVNACLNGKNFKHQVGIGISFVGRQAPKNYNSFGWSRKGFASQKLRSCFL